MAFVGALVTTHHTMFYFLSKNMSIEDVKSSPHPVGGEIVDVVSDIAVFTEAVLPASTGMARVENPFLTSKGLESNPTSVLNRRVLLKTIAVSNLDDFGELVTARVDPFALMLGNRTIARELSGFDSFRADLELEIELLTPSASFGAYAVCWQPAGCTVAQQATRVRGILQTETISQLNHVFLECCAGSKGKMLIPYHHFVDYIPTVAGNYSATNFLGELSFWCYASVTNDTTNPDVSCDMNIYGTFKNIKTVNPVRGGILQSGRADVKKDKSISTGLGVLSSMASVSTPITGAMGAVAAVGLSAASTAADAMGYTRKPAEQVPMPTQFRPFSSVAHVDGEDTGENVAQLGGACVSIDPAAHMLGQDQSSFEYLMSKWTLVKHFDWLCSTAVGTVLGAMPVTPFGCEEFSSGLYCLTTPGYCGLPYQFWRGGMEYLIIIPVSPFHRGQLRVLWNCNGSVASDVRQVEQEVSAVIDVETCNRVKVQVGYARNEIARNANIRRTDSATTQTELQDCNGFLTFVNMTRLVCQAGPTGIVPVRVLVFARAMPNSMQFACPRYSIKYETSTNTYLEKPIALALLEAGRLEGGSLEDDLTTQTVVLVPDHVVDLAGAIGSERIESLRAMAQQFGYCGYIPLTGGGGAGLDPIATVCTIIAGDGGTQPVGSATPAGTFWSMAGHATACFTSVRGGIRAKLLPVVNTIDTAGVIRPTAIAAVQPMVHTAITYSVDYTNASFYGREVSAVQTTQGLNGVEFNFPFRHLHRTYNPFCNLYNQVSGTVPAGKLCFMGVKNWPAAQKQDFLCYTAYSADVSVGHFRGTGQLAFQAIP